MRVLRGAVESLQPLSRAISLALQSMYSHTHVMRLLRARGIVPNRDADEAEGSKWSQRWGVDDDEGGDLDDEFGEAYRALGAAEASGAVGPLDAEHSEKLQALLDAVGPLFFSLGDRHKGIAVEAVRELLERMVANEPPTACEAVMMDI